jgi:hypothetical protein
MIRSLSLHLRVGTSAIDKMRFPLYAHDLIADRILHKSHFTNQSVGKKWDELGPYQRHHSLLWFLEFLLAPHPIEDIVLDFDLFCDLKKPSCSPLSLPIEEAAYIDGAHARLPGIRRNNPFDNGTYFVAVLGDCDRNFSLTCLDAGFLVASKADASLTLPQYIKRVAQDQTDLEFGQHHLDAHWAESTPGERFFALDYLHRNRHHVAMMAKLQQCRRTVHAGGRVSTLRRALHHEDRMELFHLLDAAEKDAKRMWIDESCPTLVRVCRGLFS